MLRISTTCFMECKQEIFFQKWKFNFPRFQTWKSFFPLRNLLHIYWVIILLTLRVTICEKVMAMTHLRKSSPFLILLTSYHPFFMIEGLHEDLMECAQCIKRNCVTRLRYHQTLLILTCVASIDAYEKSTRWFSCPWENLNGKEKEKVYRVEKISICIEIVESTFKDNLRTCRIMRDIIRDVHKILRATVIGDIIFRLSLKWHSTLPILIINFDHITLNAHIALDIIQGPT
jgi:hypothetical protein